MKTIVCYGDSNTWGFMPKKIAPDWSGNRFAPDVRWTGVLQRMLGEDYRVVEEGLNARTTMFDDPLGEYRNGLKYIDICLLTKMPVDLVVLMLGTNDVKEFLSVTPFAIAKGIARLVEQVQKSGCGPSGTPPKVLVISPANMGAGLKDAWPGDEFGMGALEKDRALAQYYEKTACEMSVHFLDAAKFVSADNADCVHLSAESHALLGEKVYEKTKEILG